MDLLQQGIDWLADMQAQHVSQTVLYSRGYDQVLVPAVPARTSYEVEDDDGIRVEAHSDDFLIRAADLVLAGQPTEPLPGDTIRLSRNGKTMVYEVLDLLGQGCWRYSDPYGKQYRIHAKHTNTED